MNQLLKHIITLSTGSIAVKVIGIVSLSIYTRIFEPEEIAILPVYILLTDFALIALSFGVLPTFIKLLPGYLRDDIEVARGFCRRVFVIFLVGVSISISLYFLFLDDIQQVLSSRGFIVESIEILAIGFFISAIQRLCFYMIWAEAKYANEVRCNIIGAVTRPVLAVLLLTQLGPGYFIHAIIISDFIVAITAVFFCKHIIFGASVKTHTVFGLIKYSAPFCVTSYVNVTKKEGDTFFVGLLGATELALYHVAKTFIAAILAIFTNIEKVITQKMAEVNEDAANLYQVTSKVLSLLSPLMSFAFMAFSPIFVLLIAPPQYAEAALYAFLLAFALHLRYLRMPSDRLLFTTEKPIYRLYISTLEAISLIGLMSLLVNTHQLIGVIAAKFMAALITLMLSLYFLSRVKQISHSIGYFLWPSMLAVVSSTAIFWGLYKGMPIEHWISLLFGLCLLTVYVIVSFLSNREFISSNFGFIAKKIPFLFK